MSNLICQTDWYDMYIISGRNIIKNSCIGIVTPEQVRKNREDIKETALSKFNGQPWGFIPMLTRLSTIKDPDVSKEFTAFHSEFFKIGCKAFAFITSAASIAVKIQSQRHQDISGANDLLINYFISEQNALDWLKTLGI